jgi:YggT family protein
MALVCWLLSAYVYVILIRIILSWFPISPHGSVAAVAGFLYLLTDPVLGPVRRALPPVRLGMMALDLSPIVVIIGLQVVASILPC